MQCHSYDEQLQVYYFTTIILLSAKPLHNAQYVFKMC